MRRLLVSTLFTALMASTALAADAPPLASTKLADSFTGDYVLDVNHASMVFTISHMGYSEYTGRFNRFETDLHFDAKDITKSTVKATVDLASVDTNHDELEGKLAGADWFNTEAFPKATFTSTKIKKTGKNEGKLYGNLTFMGVTKPIEMEVEFNGGGTDPYAKKGKLGFSAEGEFKRSDFGMNTYIPAIGDEVEIEIEAEFFKKD